MKHVLNIALMAVVILGLAMLEATNWGYAVLAIPAVIWAKSVLNLLHKLPVLAAAFWILVAVFAWQAALAYSHAWRSLNNIHADHSITSMPITQ